MTKQHLSDRSGLKHIWTPKELDTTHKTWISSKLRKFLSPRSRKEYKIPYITRKMFAIDIFWDRRRIFFFNHLSVTEYITQCIFQWVLYQGTHLKKKKKKLLILKINFLIQYIWPSSLHPAPPHLSCITVPSSPTVPFSFSEKSRSPRGDIKTRYNKTRQRLSYWGWWDNPIGGKEAQDESQNPFKGFQENEWDMCTLCLITHVVKTQICLLLIHIGKNTFQLSQGTLITLENPLLVLFLIFTSLLVISVWIFFLFIFI